MTQTPDYIKLEKMHSDHRGLRDLTFHPPDKMLQILTLSMVGQRQAISESSFLGILFYPTSFQQSKYYREKMLHKVILKVIHLLSRSETTALKGFWGFFIFLNCLRVSCFLELHNYCTTKLF
jgi:hypothetical protein